MALPLSKMHRKPKQGPGDQWQDAPVNSTACLSQRSMKSMTTCTSSQHEQAPTHTSTFVGTCMEGDSIEPRGLRPNAITDVSEV